MTNEEIVKWLRSKKVETGSLLCLGCGYEHNCGIHGCAVMLAAADAMENLQNENAALRRTIDNLTSAQAVVLKEFEAKLEELAEVKAERDAAINLLRSMYWCYGCTHLGQPLSANSGCDLDKLLECNEAHDLYEFGVPEEA